jgi:hypothetical protein
METNPIATNKSVNCDRLPFNQESIVLFESGRENAKKLSPNRLSQFSRIGCFPFYAPVGDTDGIAKKERSPRIAATVYYSVTMKPVMPMNVIQWGS